MINVCDRVLYKMNGHHQTRDTRKQDDYPLPFFNTIYKFHLHA